jgi:copper(I)-binding protein
MLRRFAGPDGGSPAQPGITFPDRLRRPGAGLVAMGAFATIGVLLAMAFSPPVAQAHSHKKKTLEIVHPWTAAMVEERVVNVAVYMKLKNGDRVAERLVSASTPLAEKAELVEPTVVEGVKLPAVSQSLTIPARGELMLGPDGARVLLSGFKRRLSAYDSFELTLVFEKAGPMVVEVMVEEAGTTTAPHKH